VAAGAAFKDSERFFEAVSCGVAGAGVIPSLVGADAGEFEGL
jgi:hypothetical protein